MGEGWGCTELNVRWIKIKEDSCPKQEPGKDMFASQRSETWIANPVSGYNAMRMLMRSKCLLQLDSYRGIPNKALKQYSYRRLLVLFAVKF